MKKIIAVILSAVVVFSLGVFCVSANEENGFDNFLDAYLNAMVTITEDSDAELKSWDDVLNAAKDKAEDSVGDEAESYALALDGVNNALSEFSNEEFESWNDAITYGTEQITTDFGIDKTELFDAFKGTLDKTVSLADDEVAGFSDAAAGAADACLEAISFEIEDFIKIFKSFLQAFTDYIVELTETLNWYAGK